MKSLWKMELNRSAVRILFLSPRQAVPTRSGAKLREFHLMRALAASADLTYLYFSDPGAEPLTTADLPFCHRVVAIPKPSAYGLRNNIVGLTGRWPLPILNYNSAEMSAAVARETGSSGSDVIHLESIHMVRYALAVTAKNPQARTIYDWHNIESEAMRRYSESAASPARRWYARITARKMETVERQILGSAFGHIVCSERERQQLHLTAPRARIKVIENGVDIRQFGKGAADEGGALRLIFVGAMDYFPNSDAAVFFAREIWPLVLQRLGSTELTIVGANPGPAVRALGELPGITVTGTVPDVRPFYRGALAAVVPLRTGGGTRLKILEAMAAGVAVVSTPLGAEGLEVTDGENALLVNSDDRQGWVNRLAELVELPARRADLIAAGRRLVETRYDWDLLGGKLCETYRDWLQQG
jgi:sugar transferase (PEP-CTERM/EpsH1 system associated)